MVPLSHFSASRSVIFTRTGTLRAVAAASRVACVASLLGLIYPSFGVAARHVGALEEVLSLGQLVSLRGVVVSLGVCGSLGLNIKGCSLRPISTNDFCRIGTIIGRL